MKEQDERPGDSVPSDSSPLSRDALERAAQELRRRAEAIAREKAARLPEIVKAMSPEEAQLQLHELQVHEIELTMQNEELHRVQTELDAERARYFDLYERAPVGYITLSADGSILEANLTAATLLGVTRGISAAQPLTRFILPEDQDIYYLHNKRLFETGAPQECELRMMKRDGPVFWAHVAASVVHQADGAPGHRIVLSDITERKRIEEETVAAKERAVKSERLKDAFVANISHELRTPLNIILGYITVISEKFLAVATEGDRRYFESVQRGGERLMRAVDMILSVSRLQSGEFVPKPTEVNIPVLVRRIVADHLPFAQKKKLVLSTIDACGSAVIVADEYCITQAVSNLLHNAIKFTREGMVELRVFHDNAGRLSISCRDTGIGISKDYIPLLFSRYSQEQTGYSRPFEGLGLGMALVKEYLAINDATIAVESEKGVGTTFTITFLNSGTSRVSQRTVEPAAAASLPADPSKPLRLLEAKPSVLLIEDDEMTIDFMHALLEPRWEVLTARSGPETWAILRTSLPDIILMDISITGEQTGIELTQEIRQNPAHRNIPIIAVTAHAYASDRENCLNAGCDEFIRKPINSANLFETMERLLAK